MRKDTSGPTDALWVLSHTPDCQRATFRTPLWQSRVPRRRDRNHESDSVARVACDLRRISTMSRARDAGQAVASSPHVGAPTATRVQECCTAAIPEGLSTFCDRPTLFRPIGGFEILAVSLYH